MKIMSLDHNNKHSGFFYFCYTQYHPNRHTTLEWRRYDVVLQFRRRNNVQTTSF